MSHEATIWAIKQRGLRPAVKIVLWHLCDRYHPDHGCFPSQKTLAEDCEMGRSTLNRCLDELEAAGLIRRSKRKNAETGAQTSTRYYFAFEPDTAPLSQNETPPLSQQRDTPCPSSGTPPVPVVGHEPVRLTSKGTIKSAQARDADLFSTDPTPEAIEPEVQSAKKRSSRLSPDWKLPKSLGEWAVEQGLPQSAVRLEAEKFRDYWIGAPGQKGVKADWDATWRNWIRKVLEDKRAREPESAKGLNKYQRMMARSQQL